MIGVISKPGQHAIVEEFFQLFKTPWEFYQAGNNYDVVLATADEIPDVGCQLLIVYGAETKSCDSEYRIAGRARRLGTFLRCGELEDRMLPIYGPLLTFEDNGAARICNTVDAQAAGLRGVSGQTTVLRFGYDLFQEVQFLLSEGQPLENAQIPSLDYHIDLLRECMVGAGIEFIEIPPAPAGHSCSVCLTHDIDFVGIRNHKFDHTMWGFLYRATVGTLHRYCKGWLTMAQLLQSWRAAASLPLVYLGWVKDFWEPFEWYGRVEKDLPATYFLIPFKQRAGTKVDSPIAPRRAAAYDVSDLPREAASLLKQGCEIGVHGIDAWHSAQEGREEAARVTAMTGKSDMGIRMHWLLRNDNTFQELEQAGYAYDSTVGYNETVGYRSGTTQVFRPSGAHSLLELPMHIQDGALFFPGRQNLSQAKAWAVCQEIVEHADRSGGVLTLLWHDRSHAPERFWGDFYARFVAQLRSSDAWFATASQAVDWFRKRRAVRFERANVADGGNQPSLQYDGDEIYPPLTIRLHCRAGNEKQMAASCKNTSDFVDVSWNGTTIASLLCLFGQSSDHPALSRNEDSCQASQANGYIQ